MTQVAETLKTISSTRKFLNDLEEQNVKAARDQGMTWAEIGSLLGRSRQAVWEKYSKEDFDVIEHDHSTKYPPHTHAWGSVTHGHMMRMVCSRPECEGSQRHDIHPNKNSEKP